MSKADNHEGTILREKRTNGKTVYRCRIYVGDTSQKYISASASTQREARANAKAKYKLYMRRKQAEEIDPKSKASETVSQSLKKYLETLSLQKGWRESTLLARTSEVNAISRYIGTKKVADISTSLINKCLTEMLLHYHRDTVKKCHDLLKNYIHNLYVDSVIIDDFSNLIMSIDIKGGYVEDDYRVFDSEEIDKIKFLAMNESLSFDEPNSVNHIQYKALIMYLLFLTGMRSGEMRALTTDDIDYKEHGIYIKKAKSRIKGGETNAPTKTKNSTRGIGINKHTEECFRLLEALRPSDKSNLFCITSKGTPLTDRNLLKWFNTVLEEAKIEKAGRSVRALRHTFISLSLDKDERSPLANQPLSVISRYVGHSKTSTTLDIYTQCKNKRLQDIEYDNQEEMEFIDVTFEDDSIR